MTGFMIRKSNICDWLWLSISKCMNKLVCVLWVWSLCQWVCCCLCLSPCAVISLVLSQSPEMPSDRWMRGLNPAQAVAVSVAPAAEAGVSTSRATLPAPLLPVPLSLQYGSSVWEAAIPLFSRAPPLTYQCLCGCWRRSARPNPWKGLAPNRCDTWHLGALSRLRSRLSDSFLPGQSSLRSLLQTAAILLLLMLLVCLPLLHSNQFI